MTEGRVGRVPGPLSETARCLRHPSPPHADRARTRPRTDAQRRARRAERLQAAIANPDAAAVLRLLRDRRWGIVTSGRTPTVRQRLRAGGPPDPPILVDSSQVRRGKPDPEGHLRAAQLLKVPASTAW
ncbi:HAD family hydrolase [Streptomyces sp. YS-3]|uniref:HAD family hydrolase n=1 Tax=Streptomyces sp. YS-3 TaxID=3381352 RepID=UPI003862D20A